MQNKKNEPQHRPHSKYLSEWFEKKCVCANGVGNVFPIS